MLIRIQNCFVRKTITPEVLARTGGEPWATWVHSRTAARTASERLSIPSKAARSISAASVCASRRTVTATPGPFPTGGRPGAAQADQLGRIHARPHQPTPESAHHSLYTRRGRARVFVRGPALSHPESVRIPTPTSAAGPRRRTRSVCRQSSARPSPWPPSASGSTNGHRP